MKLNNKDGDSAFDDIQDRLRELCTDFREKILDCTVDEAEEFLSYHATKHYELIGLLREEDVDIDYVVADLVKSFSVMNGGMAEAIFHLLEENTYLKGEILDKQSPTKQNFRNN